MKQEQTKQTKYTSQNKMTQKKKKKKKKTLKQLPISTKFAPPKYKSSHKSTPSFGYLLPKATIKNPRVEVVEKNSYTRQR